MSNFLNKLFGRTDDDYDDYTGLDTYESYPGEESLSGERAVPREMRQKRSSERTVPFPGTKQGVDNTVVLVEAFDIDTAWPVCDHVKQGRTVICNTDVCRRISEPVPDIVTVLLMPLAACSKPFPNLSLSLPLRQPASILMTAAWPSVRFAMPAVSRPCQD